MFLAYIYIYIQGERERERERTEGPVGLCGLRLGPIIGFQAYDMQLVRQRHRKMYEKTMVKYWTMQ